MKKILIAGILFGISVSLFAQSFKFGHIDSQELISSMPATDSAQAKLRKLTQDLEEQLELMNVELNNKYENYLSKRDSYSELIRQTKEAEIQEMQQRIQKFQMEADNDLQTQRTKLLQPIQEKALKAVQDVAREQKFTYIFDIGTGAIPYYSDQSIDIMPMVKKKLGIE